MSSSITESAVDVTMPQMGVSVAEGTIVAWHVAVGDEVSADQTICEVSTDKIDTEVPAPAGGVVSEILVGLEATVPVGAVLARISTGAGPEAAPGADSPPAAPAGQTAPASGSRNGSERHTEGPRGAPETLAVTPGPGAERVSEQPGVVAIDGQGGHRYYSPVVQRIAATHGLELSRVTGSGRNGRVTKADVLAAVEAAANGTGSAPPAEAPMHIESPYRPDPEPEATPAVARRSPAVAPVPPASTPVPQTGEAPPLQGGTLSRMRRQIGEHMKRSLDTAATCTTWMEADMSAVEAARRADGGTALAYVAAATIVALGRHPSLNATLEGDTYTVHASVHLGIAVSLGENGLIVPVIHDAQQLSVAGLRDRIKDLARRARAGELRPDEVRGGTFTITNPGQYGSMMATPVINQPQVAILDLEAVTKRPVVIEAADGSDSIGIRPMTILGLSWDHRALDGVASAQFLAALRDELARAGR